MAKGQKSRAQLEAENKVLRRYNLYQPLARIAQTLIWAGAAVAIAYIGFGAISDLAGLETEANIVLSVLGNMNFSRSVTTVFGIGGVAYGLRQRHLRRNVIERLSERPKELEELLDAKRSSSQLTPRGDTPREEP